MWLRTLIFQAVAAVALFAIISQATVSPRGLASPVSSALANPALRQGLEPREDPKRDKPKDDPKKDSKKDPKKKDPKKDPKKNKKKPLKKNKKKQPKKKKGPKKIAPKKSNWKCSAADVTKIRNPKKARKIWDASEAGVIGDEWINKHGLKNWVQDLDQRVFKKDGLTSSWNCHGREAKCELDRTCKEYQQAGHAGAFILFYSLQQQYSYLNDLREHLQDMSIKLSLDVKKIHDDFKKDKTGPVNPWIAASGSLGVVAGAGAANPVWAGFFGILSGLSSILGNTAFKPKDEDNQEKLAQQVKNTFKQGIQYCDKLAAAVYGKPGAKQSDIPKELHSQTFKNAAIKTMGEGKWLVADPVKGLKEGMDMFYFRMKQQLAWQMIRDVRLGILFIDDGVTKDKCGDGLESSVWDSKHDYCFRLFHAGGGDKLQPLDNDLAKQLWGKKSNKEKFYNMNRLETYRNALDCWKKNAGRVGKVKFEKLKNKKALPQCFFGIPMVKGKYYGEDVKKIIVPSKFPGYEGVKWVEAKDILEIGQGKDKKGKDRPMPKKKTLKKNKKGGKKDKKNKKNKKNKKDDKKGKKDDKKDKKDDKKDKKDGKDKKE
ncbi:hypothetical protein AJ79_06296 [Helicocarpus griseus UAMH5409]|uniref:Uncharacterized protein n=1 Tax=Helicocarpus griseus UAMH5409 TaxID=1447875 RepID=A0A2B7X6W7_9EURO|nr:hypothetical protein AJ79_06296 [Helicocarpus griseus UAMH5409]